MEPDGRPLDLRVGLAVKLERILLDRGGRITAMEYRMQLRRHEQHVTEAIKARYDVAATRGATVYFAKVS